MGERHILQNLKPAGTTLSIFRVFHLSDVLPGEEGCGFNVENSKPTFCINDLIHEYNIENGKHLAPLNKDQLIARTVTIIEELIGRFNTKGHEDFQQLYYQYWLHRGAKVRLECENNLEVDINGLDENGFLQVKTAEGRLISVQPDGNTFDFMKNLIAIKTN